LQFLLRLAGFRAARRQLSIKVNIYWDKYETPACADLALRHFLREVHVAHVAQVVHVAQGGAALFTRHCEGRSISTYANQTDYDAAQKQRRYA